jgi:hypothetical protein
VPSGSCLEAVEVIGSTWDSSHGLNREEEPSRRHDVDGADELVPVVQVVEGVRHARWDGEEVAGREVEDLFASLDCQQPFEDVEGVVLLFVVAQWRAGPGCHRHCQDIETSSGVVRGLEQVQAFEGLSHALGLGATKQAQR